MIKKRNFNARIYFDNLKKNKNIKLPVIKGDIRHAFHLFVIRLNNRNRLITELRKNKILVRHFKSPEKISNFIRITIGTMNQMHKLVSVMKEIVK